MIGQQIYRWEAGGYRTAAASAPLVSGGTLPELERQAQLRCLPGTAAPVYCQYPLGAGMVVSRCAADPNGVHGSYICHQLVIDGEEDLQALPALRPIGADRFMSAFVGAGKGVAALPTLQAASLSDPGAISGLFRLIDSLFDERTLAKLIAGVTLAAQDGQKNVYIVLPGGDNDVSEAGRSLMEMLMRCMPAALAQKISYCTLISPAQTAMRYTVYISPAGAKAGADANTALFDLAGDSVIAAEPDEKSATLARAYLAHDLTWIDRLRDGEGGQRLAAAPAARLDIPEFEPGMELTRYFQDWVEALKTRKSALNEDAFLTFARAEWPLFTARIIKAADVMPPEDFIVCMHAILLWLDKNRQGEALGMRPQDYDDLAAILLDSVDWDRTNLSDPEEARLMRSVTGLARRLQEDACGESMIRCCRAVHAALDPAAVAAVDGLDDLIWLSENDKPAFARIQACARRCVAERLAGDGTASVDELFVNAAILGYVRFDGGIPDFRALDGVKQAVGKQYGGKAAARFDQKLDRARRRMHASGTNHGHGREMRLMLGISLALALIILAVILAYFLR